MIIYYLSINNWIKLIKINSISSINISYLILHLSLSIFKQFYIIFDNEVQKKQIMQLLKEWEVEVTIDKKFAQQKEYERVVAEKTQMREERKRLYEARKKRKR